jgi:DUF4097 and DUF4098 domain-containing protein YvlB
MSVTEDAPAITPAARRSPVRLPGSARRASPWWWLVAASALILIVVAVVLAIWWAASRETRAGRIRVSGEATALELDLGDAPVQISGGSGLIDARRTEEASFGHPPTVTHDTRSGVVRITSRCPDIVLGTCKSSWRVAVPDNVLVNVRTSSGRVTISGLNGSARVTTGSGDVSLSRFCGFTLVVTSASGDVDSAADCSPDRIELRSGSGDIHAVVPGGRYRVDAHSDGGTDRVRGLTVADDASYTVQALSGSGDVTVEGTP